VRSRLITVRELFSEFEEVQKVVAQLGKHSNAMSLHNKTTRLMLLLNTDLPAILDQLEKS
jgi:phosphotransferase system IIB component